MGVLLRVYGTDVRTSAAMADEILARVHASLQGA
jgi:hypothetical protein